MVLLDENFWSERYKLGLTGWDIGRPSSPLLQYLDQIENKSIRVLIPGAGNAYGADYTFRIGVFKYPCFGYFSRDIGTLSFEAS